MEVLILLIFVSLVLVTGAIGFFAWGLREGVYDHADRLSLLPLEEDTGTVRTRLSSSGGTRSEESTADPAHRRKPCAADQRSSSE